MQKAPQFWHQLTHSRMRPRCQLVAAWPGTGTDVDELKKKMAAAHEDGVTELLEACRNLPFAANVAWSNSGADGFCDVVFYGREESEPAVGQEPRLDARPLGAHANDPQQAQLVRELVPELRSFLHRKLPDYLVPTRFVLLDKLPLNPNGKLDRRALNSVALAAEAATDPSALPRTETEKALAQVWCDVLHLKEVGIQDNFFDLGGHSLSVAQVIARVRQTFQVDLPMRQMFEQPTIAALAAAVQDRLVATIDALSEAEAERLTAELSARP